MKKRHITLLTAFAAAAAFASTAQADLTTGMSSVLRSESGGAYSTDGMGTSIGNLDYALGNFDVTDTAAYVAAGTPYFIHENDHGERGWVASSVLTGAGGALLAGAQYVATQDSDKSTAAQYQITFDRPGTFYLLADERASSAIFSGFAPLGYSDTGVDISYTQHGAAFGVWSQDVVASQTVTTPVFSGSVTNIGFAFQPAGGTTPAAPEIVSIVKSGDTVTVEFTGTDGKTYDLNKASSLDGTFPDSPDSNPDSTILSGTTTGTLTDPGATEDAAFYQVKQQP